MPAPHRRNKGESLAHQIKAKAASKAVADDRDNLVATRVRQAKKWNEAAAVLSPAMQRVAKEVAPVPKPPKAAKVAETCSRGHDKPEQKKPARTKDLTKGPGTARYFLGTCLDCSIELWVHSTRARVPLCPTCRGKRR